MNAVVTVKAAGCHDPAGAKVTAAALKMVNGVTRSIPLTLSPLSEPGMYGVTQQWPAEDGWVLVFNGAEDGEKTSTLVTASRNGVNRLAAKQQMREASQAELDALLQAR